MGFMFLFWILYIFFSLSCSINILITLKNILCFRSVLGSQQNWAVQTEFLPWPWLAHMLYLPIINIPHQSRGACSTDETMLTNYDQPKSIVNIMVHSSLCVFYRFGQTYHGLRLALQCCTEPFHYPKHPLDSAFSSLPPPSASTDLSTVTVILPFPECHIAGIL